MFRDSFWGPNGFDALRRYVKQGNDFCRDLSVILQERSDLEASYAKSLNKLGQKLTKVAGSCIGTLSEAWGLAAVEMDAEAELHRQLASALLEDICKPMKTLTDQQSKARKPVETMVDKAHKALTDRRAEEAKCKKNAFSYAKDREKSCEQLLAARAGKGKNTSEKDMAKTEKKIRTLEEAVRKTDREYHEVCQKAEASRQEWESSVFRAGADMQKIEEERVSQMQDFMNKYNNHLSVIGPKLIRSCDKLGEAVLSVDVTSDIRKVIDQKGTGPNQPEQLLPDFYAEDQANHMDPERRRQALQNYLIYLEQDLDREQKGREGVEKLLEVYHNRPTFADANAQEDARNRLSHVTAMLNYLEAAHHKVSCAMAQLEGRPKPNSKLTQHIERNKDKQGHSISILRLPPTLVSGGFPSDGVNRGSADGGHVDAPFDESHKRESCYMNCGAAAARKPSYKRAAPGPPQASLQRLPSQGSMGSFFSDDDEFDTDLHSAPACRCRAIYGYQAQQYDELSINQGDVITVFDKQADGWWQGELHGKIGIFPATYVEEV